MHEESVETTIARCPVGVVAAQDTLERACTVLAGTVSGAAAVVSHGRLVGLLVESEIGPRIVEGGLDVRRTRVAEVMGPRPPSVPVRSRLDDVGAMMRDRGLRHVAVTGRGRVFGLLSLRETRQRCVIAAEGPAILGHAPPRIGAEARRRGPPRVVAYSGMSPSRPST